jgi:hypothetical protein
MLIAREALAWRTEELARNACDALERDDLAVAALLTRAIIESAAFAWALLEVLETRDKHTPKTLHELAQRLVLGSKSWPDAPQPVRIGKCIDKMNKKVAGVKASYDRLSEIAHPNWHGVFGLYAEIDRAELAVYFGRRPKGWDSAWRTVANSLVAALAHFADAYNKVSDGMPTFLAELEKLPD